MSKNTGKPTEKEFEDRFARLGKAAFLYRFVDAAEVRGRTGKIGFTRDAPADYLITQEGVTSYAEVKSTSDPTAFRFSLLRQTQSATAAMVRIAGGLYDIYAHHIPTGTWYKFPYSLVQAVKDAGSGSIPWKKLENFIWSI
jgi:hypothetical protein